jgi:hypothetical protein
VEVEEESQWPWKHCDVILLLFSFISNAKNDSKDTHLGDFSPKRNFKIFFLKIKKKNPFLKMIYYTYYIY